MKRKKLLPPLCQRISEADQHRLRLHFADLATQAADKHGVKVFQIRKPSRYRAHAVCRAREEVVLGLRESVCCLDEKETVVAVQDGKRGVSCKRVRHVAIVESVPDERLASWQALSTTDIAALFPCDHSAIVLLLQRVDRRQRAATEKTNAERSDDRNRNNDSSVCGRGDSDGGDAGQGGHQPVERACEDVTRAGRGCLYRTW